MQYSLETSPMVLCRTMGMERYGGVVNDDLPWGRHRHVTGGGAAHEEFNFGQPYNGKLYGYVQIRAAGRMHVNLLKRGAADRLDGVTVVWCAQTRDLSRIVVAGWYLNARAYAEPTCRPDRLRAVDGSEILIHFRTAQENAFLLPEGRRQFVIPAARGGAPGFGQADLFYIDEKASDLAASLRAYIRGIVGTESESDLFNLGGWLGGDPARRAEVERAAMDFVKRHYGDENVEDVHKKNRGWDFEVHVGGRVLKAEVKGRAPTTPTLVLLSRNEAKKFRAAETDPEFAKDYRLCVVSDALADEPTLRIFRFASGAWRCELTSEGCKIGNLVSVGIG